MASTSRAAPAQRKPDVFVNFRGEDTRKSFVSFFRRATEENGIFAFTDEGLRGGDDISTTLVNKIFESQVAVVVFSPNYANSRWCLDELDHIIHCNQQQGQTVVPVFLQGVKPTDVRHQTGRFGDGFKESVGRYPDKNGVWIHALKKTADLSSGVFDHSSEAEIVNQLINMILSVLGKMDSHDYDSSYFGKHRIEEVKSRLSSQEINSIGIWGMAGSGKTTLAYKVCARISNNFAGVCFLENVRDRAEKGELNQLQKQMICQLRGRYHPNESSNTIYDNQTMFKLSRIPVLIVFDDVSDVFQVENVIGDWRNYGTGSKLIMTSRDMQVLKNMCNDVYEVKLLDDTDSLQLLQHHMFKKRQPTAEQIELLRQTRLHAQGLPLCLVIMGRRLYDKNVITWRSALENLRDSPDQGIMKILRSSFDELDYIHASMFLDIACLLHCSSGDCMGIILKACGFGSISIIDRLTDKALITINQSKQLCMHDLLRQMGDEIGKHNRLWKWKDTADVLSNNKGISRKRKRNIEVISPEMSVGRKIKLQPHVFEDMGRLRILRLREGCAENISMSQGLKYLPNDLRYLKWNNYPSPSLPSLTDLENLVEVRMRYSNLKKLWCGKVLKMESQYNSGANRESELVLPGSEFPEGWFKNSSSACEMGCTSFMADTSWRSVADPVAAVIFGVVLDVVAPVSNFSESCICVKCEWESESGQVLCSKNSYTFEEDMGECAVMWLHLVNPSMFCFPDTFSHFSVYDCWDDAHVLRDNVVILKCGIAPIYESSYTNR